MAASKAFKRRQDPTAIFTWDPSKENPFKRNGKIYRRVEIVRQMSGQPVAAIRGHEGLKETTLDTCLRKRLGWVS